MEVLTESDPGAAVQMARGEALLEDTGANRLAL